MAYSKPNFQQNYSQESEEDRLSKYNSGVAIQIRVNYIWQAANEHSRQEKYKKWNLDLDNIWRELARDLKPEVFKEKKKDFDGFDTRIKKAGKFVDYEPSGWKALTQDQIENRETHYMILCEKEIFLKRLENELGKGTAWADDDQDDFD